MRPADRRRDLGDRMDRFRVVGLGGSTRQGSSTETLVRAIVEQLGHRGAVSQVFAGPDLVLPLYEPGHASDSGMGLIRAVQGADALVVGSPGYHGTVSGLVKNALDYLEDLRDDERPYLEGRAVACVATAYGWQAAVSTMNTLRETVHALRGWPTPYGIALNVAQGLVDDGGEWLDPRVSESIDLLADQVAEFVVSMRSHHSSTEKLFG